MIRSFKKKKILISNFLIFIFQKEKKKKRIKFSPLSEFPLKPWPQVSLCEHQSCDITDTENCTCRPMTHCPAFIFSSSNILCCLSAYFTPMSTRDWQPLVLAWEKRRCRRVLIKLRSFPTKNYHYRLWCDVFRDSPCWRGRAESSGPASCCHSQTDHWPRRYHGASSRTLWELWWSLSGSPAKAAPK